MSDSAGERTRRMNEGVVRRPPPAHSVPPARSSADGIRDARRDRRTLLVTSGLLVLLFAIGSATQTVTVYGLGLVPGTGAGVNPMNSLLPRLLANLLTTAALLVYLWFARIEARQGVSRVLSVALGVLVLAGVRLALQLALGLYRGRPIPLLLDFATAVVVASLCLMLGLVFVAVQRRLREEELANARQRLRAATALAALQSEELRVRREVAEGLHGTVQQRLVLLGAELDGVVRRLEREDGTSAQRRGEEALDGLRVLGRKLDVLREVDVREVSQLLYPAGVELGLAQAVRMMMRRVPRTIAIEMAIHPSVLAADGPAEAGLTVAERLLLVRVLEEAVSNALRHGHASLLHLELGIDQGAVVLCLDDDGLGMPQPAPPLNGLSLVAERIEAAGGSLSLEQGAQRGVRLTARLPIGTLAQGGEPAA